MKRFIVLSVSMAIASNSFAYYSDYTSSSDSLIPGWVIFIVVVSGILQGILFFKIWGMTNDVKALKKDHFVEMELENKDIVAWYLRKSLFLGNIENAKKYSCKTLFTMLNLIMLNLKSATMKRMRIEKQSM